MDLLEWVFNVKTEYSWFLLFVKCFLCVDLTTGMSGHRWASNQSIWLVHFSSRLESGNVPACQAGGLSHLNSEAPVMMKDAETRSRFLWISAQTEDIAALEVSFLNSVYLRPGGDGGVRWEEGLLAGPCDGVEDRAGCHNSLGTVLLKWQRGLAHPPGTISSTAKGSFWFCGLWYALCSLLNVYDVHACLKWLPFGLSERMDGLQWGALMQQYSIDRKQWPFEV